MPATHPSTPLRRLFQIPDDVKTVDFVHQIDRAASAERILRTLTDYQVTPSIQRNLERALDNIRRGVEDRRSVFTWIHGSFGCGKSHFMNVLSLLVADEKAVYTTHVELEKQRKDYHPAVIGKKFFRLHVQCISRTATSMEEIVLGAAVEELQRVHPDAPMPALFEVQKLFSSAKQLLQDLGDEKFFAAFPSNKVDDAAWGDFAGWDRNRFEAALAKPGSKEARDLAGELAKTPWLEGMASGAELVKLGPGLQILAEHLKRLGYEGVILFLDELVLWLSSFQDHKKLALETPKVSTLVEHGDYPPVLPYLTFAARQRDLSEMAGKAAIGNEETTFRDHLSFWKDRFETISLEDKDLPRIIEKRVLRSTGKEATAEIDKAFEQYKKTFASDFRHLNGNQGDADDFRRVYPFTPALVEVMVALSATLQRDRTALRELTNLLARYLPDFELGKVVPVGDLFDVVAHGQTSDLPTIQKLYEQARRIYEYDLLPHIQKRNDTASPEKCQLLRENFDKRLGCSGCPQEKCRTQTRMAKTVLLQGLVPNTPVLRNLTAQGLVYLNSGTLKSKVPNQEPSQAAALVRDLTDASPAIHVEGNANPIVRCVLDVIDVRRILDHCRDLDNEQRRRIKVRQILYERMQIKMEDQTGTRLVEWRGRKWRVGFVYENVRLANLNQFRPGAEEDVRVMLDFPFDEVGYGPRADEEHVETALAQLSNKEAERGLATIVWLPAFLDEATRQVLADLCVLDGLVPLQDKDLATRVPWVSMDELSRVRGTLEQQQGHKKQQIENALMRAYGVTPGNAALAPGMTPEHRAHLLRQDMYLNIPADNMFDQALESLVKQALEARSPRHPVFAKTPTKQRLESVLQALGKLLETPERKARFDRGQIEDLRGIAAAEHLNIVRVIEDDVMYAGGIFDSMAKNLAQTKGTYSVGAVREAIDPDGWMELSREVQDFLVLAYAKAATKPLQFVDQGHIVEGQIGKLRDDVSLVPVELPRQEVWHAAIETSKLFGLTLGNALTPARVDEFAVKVREAARKIDVPKVEAALNLLGQWQRLAGVTQPVEETSRGMTLMAVRDLAHTVQNAGSQAMKMVEALGQLRLDSGRSTAITRMNESGMVELLLDTLRSDNLKTPFAAWERVADDPVRGAEVQSVMKTVRDALTQNEQIMGLRPVLEREGAKLMQLLIAASTPPPAPVPGGQPPIRMEQPSVAQMAQMGQMGQTFNPAVQQVRHIELVPPKQASLGFTAPVHSPSKPTSKSMQVETLQSKADLERLTRELQTRLEQLGPGEHLRVTIEVVGGES